MPLADLSDNEYLYTQVSFGRNAMELRSSRLCVVLNECLSITARERREQRQRQRRAVRDCAIASCISFAATKRNSGKQWRWCIKRGEVSKDERL